MFREKCAVYSYPVIMTPALQKCTLLLLLSYGPLRLQKALQLFMAISDNVPLKLLILSNVKEE